MRWKDGWAAGDKLAHESVKLSNVLLKAFHSLFKCFPRLSLMYKRGTHFYKSLSFVTLDCDVLSRHSRIQRAGCRPRIGLVAATAALIKILLVDTWHIG